MGINTWSCIIHQLRPSLPWSLRKWNTIVAPPSWLTGHLLRQDCLLAPIPAADYAAHFDELALIPDIGISSRGEVGSVLLFGNRPIEKMRDIAFPSDSSTSVKLMKHILELRNLNLDPSAWAQI